MRNCWLEVAIVHYTVAVQRILSLLGQMVAKLTAAGTTDIWKELWRNQHSMTQIDRCTLISIRELSTRSSLSQLNI